MRGHKAFLCALAIALIPSLVSSRSAQEVPRETRERAKADLALYHRALAAYAAGDTAASLDVLAAWSVNRLRDATSRINTADDAIRWDGERYRRASMLHADIALSRAGGSGSRKAAVHLQIAASLLAQGSGSFDSVRAFSPRWFEAVSRCLRDADAPFVAEWLLADARRWLPDDPTVLYESGTLAELLATDFAMADAPPAEPFADGPRRQLNWLDRRRMKRLDDAEQWLRKVTGRAPDDALTRLHLGHVQALRGQDVEALTLLGELLDRSGDAPTRYLAAMFIGAVRDGQGRSRDAAAAYRTALSNAPTAHAAHIALSEVLARMDEVDEARSVLAALLAVSPRNVVDPRWQYLFEPPGRASQRLSTLRAEVRQ